MRYLWRVKIDGLWYVGAYYRFLPYTPCPVGHKDDPEEYKHVLIQTESSDWNMPRSITGVDIPKNCLDTLGQCTGLKDKNGTYIYEGDICEYDIKGEQQIGEIYYDYTFGAFITKPYDILGYKKLNECKIVGNKWEDVDLWKSLNRKIF